jgi:hypothetical protein
MPWCALKDAAYHLLVQHDWAEAQRAPFSLLRADALPFLHGLRPTPPALYCVAAAARSASASAQRAGRGAAQARLSAAPVQFSAVLAQLSPEPVPTLESTSLVTRWSRFQS